MQTIKSIKSQTRIKHDSPKKAKQTGIQHKKRSISEREEPKILWRSWQISLLMLGTIPLMAIGGAVMASSVRDSMPGDLDNLDSGMVFVWC